MPGGLTALILVLPVLAAAQHGMDDERVSLPDGPGSVSGAGGRAATDNRGAFRYQFPLQLPAGHAEATPALTLAYDSHSGSGELGLGWSLPVAYLERDTHRGVPAYRQDDVFVSAEDGELVLVDHEGSVREYRARFEANFVRYRFHADPIGRGGYWEAAHPDGSRSFFGADAGGNLIDSARVSGPAGGVFRYHLAEHVDRFGHRVRYEYAQDGRYRLLRAVRYVLGRDGPPYTVKLLYQPRPDLVSTGKPGFELVLTRRLSEVRVQNGAQVLRRYVLHYAKPSGTVSLLSAISQVGLDGGRHPVTLRLTYSSPQGPEPRLWNMGRLLAGSGRGVDMSSGHASLIDINGDSLPDILDTSWAGRHRFFLHRLEPSGEHRFSPARQSESTPHGSAFSLHAPGVQLLDMNGDGLTDLVQGTLGQVLCNDGSGDWAEHTACDGHGTRWALTEDGVGDPDPSHVRFYDYDGDHRMDVLRTPSPHETSVLHNLPQGLREVPAAPLGAAFDESRLQLADLNGDGLLDPAEVLDSGELRYRLNLGLGQWTSPFRAHRLDEAGGEGALSKTSLQDLNGDGLDDAVVVQGNTVKVAWNLSGRFATFETFGPKDVRGGLPVHDETTSVLFADMNGSGTTDVVWVDADGHVQFLELFAARPHLLTHIDNGVGATQRVEYGASASERARDAANGRDWQHRLPQAMTLVKAVESFAAPFDEHVDRLNFVYHEGHYDGVERRYRGFQQIERWRVASENQPARLRVETYSVGDEGAYLSGVLLESAVYNVQGEARTPLSRQKQTYRDCPLADFSETSHPTRAVHFACRVASTEQLQEGAAEELWVTLRREFRMDGYGQVTQLIDHGVSGLGPKGEQACAPCEADDPGTVSGPCGPRCLGDEQVQQSEYIPPGPATAGLWQLGVAWRTRQFGDAQGPHREWLTFYDGEPFRGLASQQLRTGLVSRVCERTTPEAAPNCEGPGWVERVRRAHDEHGNVTTELDPLGAPEDHTGHRKRTEYDADALRPVAEEMFLSDSEGPYRLRRAFAYDDTWNAVASASSWEVVDGAARAPRERTRFAYDDFGRLEKVAEPGDSLDAPTREFIYDLGTSRRRIGVLERSVSGDAPDVETWRCLDALGRAYATERLEERGVYQVSGYRKLNARGLPVRAYPPHRSQGGCEHPPPEQTPFETHHYDALDRWTSTDVPDAALYGVASHRRVERAPLRSWYFDATDTATEHPAFDTPSLQEHDGLGRTIRLARSWTSRDAAAWVRLRWDRLGNLAGYDSSTGLRQRQFHDLSGRVVRVEAPDGGIRTYRHDRAGNLRSLSDARGVTLHMQYDGDNRLVASHAQGAVATTLQRLRYDRAPDCPACTEGAGQVLRVEYPLGVAGGTGRDELGYDARGRRVYRARTLEGHRFETRWDYDNLARILRVTHPDGRVVTRHRDALARTRSIAGVIDDSQFSPRGLLIGLHYANGTRLTQQHDILGRLQRSRLGKGGDRALGDLRYLWDRSGQLTDAKDLRATSGAAPNLSARYTHDGFLRMVAARFIHAQEELNIGFDLGDRITHKDSSLGSASAAHVGAYEYSYGRPNAVVRAGTLELDYDAAGHLMRRAGVSLERDALGRVLGSQRDSETGPQYVHGPGERVMTLEDGGVTYHVGEDFEVRDGIAVTQVRLENQQVARLSSTTLATRVLPDQTGDARLSVADAWLTRPSSSRIRRYLRASVRRLLFEAEGAAVFLHSDHLNSPTLATDNAGRLRGARAFYPTGELRFTHGHVGVHGFTGQRRDPFNGLTHFAYRELDTSTGRWAAPDPWFAVARPEALARWGEATTGYAYVAGRWSSSADPTGLMLRHVAFAAKKTRHLQTTTRRPITGRLGHGVVTPMTPVQRRVGELWGNTLKGKPRSVTPGGTGRALAGHGAYTGGTTRVPAGTQVTVWTRHGEKLPDRLGFIVEMGRYQFGLAAYPETTRGAQTYLSGAVMPDYLLAPAVGNQVAESSFMVDRVTPLSGLLAPNLGRVDFAACLTCLMPPGW